jgi:hypothetical protein
LFLHGNGSSWCLNKYSRFARGGLSNLMRLATIKRARIAADARLCAPTTVALFLPARVYFGRINITVAGV